VAGREGRWSKQSKAPRGRQWTKRGVDPLREDHAWSERHGNKQLKSATRFAAPSAGAPNAAAALGWLFFVCGTGAHGQPHRVCTWREVADLKVGTTAASHAERGVGNRDAPLPKPLPAR
jgi:hypothetical protein